MSEIKNGKQPAFGFGYANHLSYHQENGLTKREYFAAMAMQGIFNNGDTYLFEPDVNCKRAVEYADALLKELEQ